MMQYILALAFTFFSLTATPADAGFRDGMDAYEAGDFETAVAQWRPLAEQGDPWALYRLGRAYRHAEGVPRDYARALVLMKRAAAQTANVDVYRRAVYALAYMTEYGHGVAPDLEKAECLYRVSAENGYANGQYALYLILLDKPDFLNPEAVDWAERAARQGDPNSLYERGRYMRMNPRRDKAFSYMYLILAAKFGNPFAQEDVAEIRSDPDPGVQVDFLKAMENALAWRATLETMPAKPVAAPIACLP